jgi:hypothetical protein
MARYKDYCYEQDRMIPISFRAQILPGTFEYTLSHLIDHELDLSVFDQRYCNDDTGRPAYDMEAVLYGSQYQEDPSIWHGIRIAG